jgi:hypothetical protein
MFIGSPKNQFKEFCAAEARFECKLEHFLGLKEIHKYLNSLTL